nr:MAG: hypothetical protein DIU70_08105 [Bacillota bacterium]
MRLFGRGGSQFRGLSGEIRRAWEDPAFHRQHPILCSLLHGFFPDLCPCTKVIPGYGTPVLFGQVEGARSGPPGGPGRPAAGGPSASGPGGQGSSGWTGAQGSGWPGGQGPGWSGGPGPGWPAGQGPGWPGGAGPW